MNLASEATELVLVLNKIVNGLESYYKDSGQAYTSKMAARLKPLVSSFENFLTVEKSKKVAKLQLDEIKELMHNVNGAATKGELDFVSGDVLSRYWELSTIFQETRFSHETL
jgi:hypothetical protein